MQAIYKEIRAIRSDLKNEMSEFRLSFCDDMRKALTLALKNQEALQVKLTELEARSRGNNLRIYGIPEESEGSNLSEFLTKLIKSQLGLPLADMDFGIQHCHHALTPKPPQGAPPRSLVICFLEFRVKELVLRAAWRMKDVRYNGKRIYFDQDYPPEILKKRKAYVGILRELKAKGIHFQTPHPAKLKVFFDSGTEVYESVAEAAKDLTKRGFSLENVKEPESTVLKQQSLATWEKASADHHRQLVDRGRIRERLRSFQRAQPSTPDASE